MKTHHLLLLNNLFELLACVVGFYSWNKIKNTYWKYFPIYLLVILMTEIVSEYYSMVLGKLTVNVVIYRYWGVPIQLFFFFWIFYQYFKKTKYRHLPLLCLIIYIMCFAFDQIWLQNIYPWFNSFSYSIGCILLLIQILAFKTILANSIELIDYNKNMMLWVCIGMLTFYIGSLPFWSLREYMMLYMPIYYKTYFTLQFGLSYIMYLFFAIAFICGQPKLKYF